MTSKKDSQAQSKPETGIQFIANEQTFHLLFENHPIPMVVCDLKTLEFLMVNETAVTTYGYSKDELKHLTLKDIITEKDMTRLLEDMSGRRKIVQHTEWSTRRKNGLIIEVDVTSHILDFDSRRAILVMAQDITERKQAESAMRISEEKFRKAFMISPDAISINRLSDGVYIAVNRGFLQIMGYEEAECIGKNSIDLNIWDDRHDLAALVAGLKKTGEVANLEARFRARNGDIKYGMMSASILELEGVQHVICITRDITSSRQEQENLAASESEMRALFASMRDAVMVIDREGVYRKVAPTNPGLLILPPQELLGKNLRDIFSDEQADIFLNAIHKVLETQQPSRIDYKLLIDERPVWFATSISPMDANNTLWVARDITARRLANEALRESEERYHALFDRMMDGIYRSTHDGRFVDVNPAMVKMFGYSNKEEMLAVDIKNELYFSPEERGSHILDTGQEETEEYRMRRKDGAEIWVEDHGYYVHDELGKPKYHEGMLRDITSRKQVEYSLRKLKKAVDTSTEAIFLTDPQGIFTYINPGFTALYGFTAEEVVGKVTPRILKCGLLDPKVYSEFWGKLVNRQDVRGELLNKRKDGKLIDIDGSATPILDDADNVIGYLAIQRDITKRKQLDDELRWAEERYRKLFEEAPMMQIVTRRQSGEPIIIDCNQTFLNTMGFTREEVIGHTLADFYTPASRVALHGRDGYLRALNGKYVSDERELLARDGRVIQTMLTATPEVNARGVVIGTHAIYVDITERKLAEEALKIAEENFRSIFENATVGIYQSTPDGRFLSVNPVMARIFGYDSPQDMLDSIVSIETQYYVDPSARQEFKRLMIEQGLVNEFNSLNYRKDGSRLHVQESARAVKDAQGNIQYYEGFVSDITERKYSEESLRESEARFRHMADTTPALVWMSGINALCNYFNKPWLDFTGRTMKQELGNGWVEGVHPEDYEHCIGTYKNAFSARVEFKMEYRLRRADGEYRWMLDHGVPRFSVEGEFFGYIGSCIDISDFKNAEDELHRVNASLKTAHRELEESLSHEQILARTDGMTGLYNYRHFFELASREFDASVRYQRPLTIIIFDTDHLKQVNDTLGHVAGDKMLVTVAQTASVQIRSADSFARYGGDEFVILLPQTSAQAAHVIAERIRTSIAAIRIMTEKGPLSVTLSIGIAEMRNDPADESVEQVVQRADKALYAAKQGGRNRSVIFDTELQGGTKQK